MTGFYEQHRETLYSLIINIYYVIITKQTNGKAFWKIMYRSSFSAVYFDSITRFRDTPESFSIEPLNYLL